MDRSTRPAPRRSAAMPRLLAERLLACDVVSDDPLWRHGCTAKTSLTDLSACAELPSSGVPRDTSEKPRLLSRPAPTSATQNANISAQISRCLGVTGAISHSRRASLALVAQARNAGAMRSGA